MSNIIEQTDGNHTLHLQEVYKDTLSNTWYQLVDVETLPAKRYAVIDNKQGYLEIGTDKYTMHSAYNMINELALSGETVRIEQIPQITKMLKDRTDYNFNSMNILELASSMYTINEEKIHQPSEYYTDLKMDAFRKDNDVRDFFLTLSFEIAKKLSAKYSQYSNVSLKELVAKENLWNRHFGNMMDKLK